MTGPACLVPARRRRRVLPFPGAQNPSPSCLFSHIRTIC